MSGIKCDICPNNCTLNTHGKGLCGNRLDNLGKFSAGHLDPIEKKPLYHVNPGTYTFSMGSIGCNLKCPWCQNWSISKEYKGIMDTGLKYLKSIDLLNLTLTEKVDSLTFTYNEPSISYEYVVEASALLKKNDIKTYLVSNGYISPKYLESFYQNIIAVNIDLKSFNREVYKKIIGCDLDVILNTLKFLRDSNTWFEITTLLIPGLNDSEYEIKQLVNWVYTELGNKVPIHFSAYYPCYKYTKAERTPPESIFKAVEIARDAGLKFVYSGNISDNRYVNTMCPECNTTLISREGYKTKSYLESGHCPNPLCKRPLEGVFN
jgi:pyruvate formate lyase activating enzyme